MNATTTKQHSSSSKKRKVDEVDGQDLESAGDWETLFKELQAERVTKAEALLHAHVQESEEREKLMRSYNQELESENQVLRAKQAAQPQQQQQLQDLHSQLKQLQSQLSNQTATIQAYQKLTGTTLSNVNIINDNNNQLDSDCTVHNEETKMTTKFRICTVAGDETLLKYQCLENPQCLPDFLRDEIEFEGSQLPPLLQNVLRGMFPEQDEEE